MYVFDLDGTIADNAHRQHLVQREKGKKDWDGFHKACVDDIPMSHLIKLMHLLKAAGHMLYIVSGRNGHVIKETQAWLKKHNVPYDALYMRPALDHRDDRDIKLEMLRAIESDNPNDEVEIIFDDRQKVVDMWRENGYVCFQVAPGDF